LSQPLSGFAPAADITHPLLLECDSSGKVLWMSQRTREVCGEPAYLSDVILVVRPAAGDVYHSHRVRSWLFSRIWETRRTVVICMRPPHLTDPAALEFPRLERRLIQGFFRLLEQERKLSESARRRRKPSGGRTAVRQIEMERQRLGRELHTGIGQTLAAIRLQLEIIGAHAPVLPEVVKEALDRIGSLAGDALVQVRSVSKRLYPPDWQRLKIEDALRQLWELSGVPGRLSGELLINELPVEPVPEVKAVLYRALQEALSNIVRHAEASRVSVSLDTHGERAVLTIQDNGCGFDLKALASASAGVAAGTGWY
jgi:two-component system NarL family sensor kinase